MILIACVKCKKKPFTWNGGSLYEEANFLLCQPYVQSPLPPFSAVLPSPHCPLFPPPIHTFFSCIFFRGFCEYCVPLPPLRGQHMVLCHPRWLPTSGLIEFAMCWGGAGFEPRTTDLQSGAPLSHLSSYYDITTTDHINMPESSSVGHTYSFALVC